ncbi:hypothetical protein PACTADRAFT_50199 [Pachysolen tannophilus NRRL Y-2460]|uniref:SIS domain-containing protein n=1 Tax=Pachysolen tannophilus NRRL Y-2460 TaxID=669874 RepID=A0A1E4TUM7_PACTA|nr:hypothetical protein PACTADRAFT_50199 [Pachysolen tannophilus NRRL Y-2460]
MGNKSNSVSLSSLNDVNEIGSCDLAFDKSIAVITSILSTQTQSIAHLTSQYKNSKWSQQQLKQSLDIMNESLRKGGKIVVSGIGKSYKIASKTVATMNSLCLHASLLHPAEALHGDLGMVKEYQGDCMILISASGKSPELIQLLAHVPLMVPIILLTCTKVSILSQHPQVKSLLYAEFPSKFHEENIYGLSAPTLSTTLCLSLMDSVSIALAELHVSDINIRKRLFGERHPGGAIGQAYSLPSSSAQSLKSCASISDLKSLETISQTSDESAQSKITPSAVIPSDIDEYTLNLIDNSLSDLIKNSTNVKYLQKLPNDELELLRLITLYDFLIIDNQKGIDSKSIIEIIRVSHQQGDAWNETTWKIHEATKRIIV